MRRAIIGFLLGLPVLLMAPGLAQAQQLSGFDLPEHGRKGVFSPGLLRGYCENQVLPFKASIDPSDLEDARLRNEAEGNPGTYTITLGMPTYSDHTPPKPSEANAENEMLFGIGIGGELPMGPSVGNYGDLPDAEAPAKELLGQNGKFVFGVVAYIPAWGDWMATKTQGSIVEVTNRFYVGHPKFPNGVTGLLFDVDFDLTLPSPGKGKKEPPPPACTIQYGIRLAPSGLPPIVPTDHPDWGGAPVPGACSFHPGPGLLHAMYEVNKPTGRSTVPIVCHCGVPSVCLVKVSGIKFDDSDLDHTYDVGDAPIAGVVIELRDGSCDGDVLDADTTDEFGRYELMTMVPCGTTPTLVIVEDSSGAGQTLDSSKWVQTTPQTDCGGTPIAEDFFPVGMGVYIEQPTVNGEVVLTGRNFGNIPPQRFSAQGTKWCDYDIDHSLDVGDERIEGVVIELRDGGCNGTLLDSDVTDSNGEYMLTTELQFGTEVDLYIVEDSTGPGETLDGGNAWVQTTPQTDCSGAAIAADWFTVGAGVFIESFAPYDDVLLSGRDFGNVRLAFGEVGERTPGFWCSQVHLEMDGQGGSEPCNETIAACSGSVREHLNKAIDEWEANCGGVNQWIFADRLGLPHADHDYTLEQLEEILCPQAGEAEHNQFERQFLALLGNVTDYECLSNGSPCSVGSPNGLGQVLFLNGEFTTVGNVLDEVCVGGDVTYEDLADINENNITVTVHDCGN